MNASADVTTTLESLPVTSRGPASTPDSCEVHEIHLDRVAETRAALPDENQLLRLAELLALLANATRLKILLALQAETTGSRELCVCDLAVVSGASKSMTSHQLRLLRMAGLVVQRRAGKLAFYRLADGAVVELLHGALTEALGRGPTQAGGHSESESRRRRMENTGTQSRDRVR